ncbi:CMRF35-like molecule 1 [Sinocyclocheilus anshuiensis]|uniref:CMRF35-like molecule 1 n=1 Tax=Sinocyclocheilus anshuiensis TaxID=1608454 RepID=UPI0007BA1FDF|nr:PREDICTED: CMRF35-like molecule 1 [Sinocyclocheilus anshuiensis]
MSSMCVVLLVFSSICTVVAGAPVTVTGHRGHRLDIRCPYESGYGSNSKYFCKGKCNFANIMVKSGSPAKDQRFSLTDDTTARVFTITVTDLRTEDAGQYWSAVKRILTDVYSEMLLLVKQAEPPYLSTSAMNSPSSIITITDHLKNTDLASVAGGLGSVLLVLVLCSGTFLILKKRKRKSGTALFQQNVPHNTEADRMYEEILNSDVVAAASSSNQTPASHLNTRPQVSTVYATVTNQKPDSNPRHTHSTNQVTDTDCDYYANIKSPEPTTDSRIELIYATATHPQNIKTNEGPIYSTINHK